MALVVDGQGEAGAPRRDVASRSSRRRTSCATTRGCSPGRRSARCGCARARWAVGSSRCAFEQARSQAALGVLPSLLHYLARDQATTDQWPAAEASYDEAIRLARETGQRTELAAALAGLAWLEARQGREAACRAHAAEASGAVRGARSRPLRRLGGAGARRPRARPRASRGRRSSATSSRWPRCEAPASPTSTSRRRRSSSRPTCGSGGAPRPRRLLPRTRPRRRGEGPAVGARPRRALPRPARGRRRARRVLRAGARPPRAHAGRVRDGPHAAGVRRAAAPRRASACAPASSCARRSRRSTGSARGRGPTRRPPSSRRPARRRAAATSSTLDELTPQELQIARLLAEGRTTREAAAAIFLSPKTVEYHLRHVYRKLGIRSREELAATLDTS